MLPRSVRSPLLLVALVLTAAGCARAWKQFAYEGFSRDDWQQPQRVIEVLAIEPGATIADLGAGSGYFTFDLAEATGPDGIVYAVDIDPDMIALLSERKTGEKADNVRVVTATPDDPGLPDGSVDLVFTSNTYHHLDDPVAYFAALRKDLAADARVAILDLRPEAGWFQRWSGHSTPAQQIRDEMARAGYRVEDEQDFVERQSFLVFVVAATP